MKPSELWQRYQQYLCHVSSVGVTLDVSRMRFDESFLQEMDNSMARALDAMADLERGALANQDENRRVGHYWLRAPDRAPEESIRTAIRDSIDAVKGFAHDVHAGRITPQRGDGFYIVLVIGIGGSALGPKLVCDALSTADDAVITRFLDNTDPDGIERVLQELDETLAGTLTIVISKSGKTRETHNTMLEVKHAYQQAGLDFSRHAVAITTPGSVLHDRALAEKWLRTFPIWDYVGGRTSVTSSVGLLPAALQGVDIDAFLAGARACDEATRNRDVLHNPAALLALMWFYAGNGLGRRHMVVLPYRDRLVLLGRYLQQLVMESLGKEKDRDGNVVHQGLTVFGNKGTTDQHAYVQQLMEGPNDFFVQFVDVLSGRDSSLFVEEDVTTADYLHAFLLGTRRALDEKGRESITLTLEDLSPRSLGALIALFERAVGLYAELINVNAYHQPGVEAGKRAAGAILDLQRRVLAHLRDDPDESHSAEDIAAAINQTDDVETIEHLLRHLSASPDHGVQSSEGATPGRLVYKLRPI